jgi:glutathione synthase/RimK-type ligase-like ATP-grasp enzyme
MKIAIHNKTGGFSERWVAYCIQQKIEYKLVDCYSTNIIEQLSDCDALMWHHSHVNSKDVLFAQKLLSAIEHSGKVVFPNFKTAWHFDDKVAQKYLLESINAPLVKSWVFYNKNEATEWAKRTTYPKVFKLRGGSGSSNVLLAKSKFDAIKLIKQAFGKGFKQNDAISGLKERWRKYRLGKLKFIDVLKGIVRLFHETKYSKIAGYEKGYVYFQEFIPNNDSDIRVIVIDEKAFAIKRLVRDKDFRASGSGSIVYNKELFDIETIKLSFELTDKLDAQSVAFDYVYDNGKPQLVEISYGFIKEVYDPCEGYWDKDLKWHEGNFDFCGWMVEMLL